MNPIIGWILAGAILGIILFVFLSRVFIIIEAGEEVRLTLRLFRFLRIGIFPKKQKKPVKIKQFSPDKVQKREEKRLKKALKKEQKKLKKQQEKQKKKETSPKEPKKKKPIGEQIDLILELLRVFLPRFAKYLRIDVTRINIRVASEDAAKTAILYGTVCQSVSYLLNTLDVVTHVKTNRKTEVSVTADFLSEKLSADLHIAFSISPWQAIKLAFAVLFGFMGHTVRKSINSSTGKE